MTGPAYFTVVQAYEIVSQPSENSGGTITFTPTPSEAESTVYDTTFALQMVEGRWAAGVLSTLGGTPGLQLVDNVNLNLAAGALVYRVDYRPPILQSFSFAAPGDGSTVDLSTVTRIPA